MNTTKIEKEGQVFLKVELEQIKQKNNSFFVAKINAHDFLRIYTVRPAVYDLGKHSALANSFPDESDYYDHLIKEDKANIKEKDFQRDPSSQRVKSIVEYIQKKDFAFFPNTIIANCELINDWGDFQLSESDPEDDFFNIKDKPSFISFLKKQEDKYCLIIPFCENSVLVIDGQHRLEGLKNVDEALQKSYELLIAFIIGFDRSVVAKQFYTINYEQKPVNKSLLYQLTGEFSREIDELSFMHNLVKILNEINDSPFYGRVKMLGKTPMDLPSEQRRMLSISQSFLIDSTLRFISPRALGTKYPPIFLKYFNNSKEHILIVRTISRFFNAVKSIKPDWEAPYLSVLSKGMGVSALLKVLNIMFPVIFYKEMDGRWELIDNLKIEDFKKYLAGLERVDFGTDGPFGKMGSAGNVAKIRDGILSNLSYFGCPKDLKAFERDLKIEYLDRFNKDLKSFQINN
ncbi:MAG: DGQHR domain-containing protein [Saprospiraceae bacterium]